MTFPPGLIRVHFITFEFWGCGLSAFLTCWDIFFLNVSNRNKQNSTRSVTKMEKKFIKSDEKLHV